MYRLMKIIKNYPRSSWEAIKIRRSFLLDVRIDEVSATSRETYISYLESLISKSGLFDPEYYLSQNKDVKKAGIDPLRHYLLHGGLEGRNPSKYFDSPFYLSRNADVRESGINPLVHYLVQGKAQGRLPKNSQESIRDKKLYEYEQGKKNIRNQFDNKKEKGGDQFNKIAKAKIDKLLAADGLVIYPLSYTLEVKQRPDHFFRFLGHNNYPCLILESDVSNKPYFRQHDKNVFVTNLFIETVTYIKNKSTILYITYPFYSFIVDELRPAKVIYDVLDDLTTFSGNVDGLRRDHEKLLETADLIMFSSKELFVKDTQVPESKKILVENGVWPADFRSKNVPNKYNFAKTGEKIIGYYGAVSNILDWELLAQIVKIKGIRLVLIGPISDFVNANNEYINLRDYVFKQNNVTYIKTVNYDELPKYASYFHAGIVPFLVSDITNPVSPIKLFEYMASGLKIFATPTTTLLEYKDVITVKSSKELINEIEKWAGQDPVTDIRNYKSIVKKADWNYKFAPVFKRLKEIKTNKGKVLPKNVDIISVNFYDQEGNVLFKGGAERYIFDLAKILQAMGHKPRIFQNAHHPFKKNYCGIEIIGIDSEVRGTNGRSMRAMSRAFYVACSNADLIIASPLDLACEIYTIPVIGINHGIHWDTIKNRLSNNRTSNHLEIFDAIEKTSSCICVDTNFINWIRTYDYELGLKLRYIPNYFDKNEFKPIKKDFTKILKFLYPRRLYDARGIFITLKAFDYLLAKYSNIELLLVGQLTDSEVIRSVKLIMKKYPKRISLEEYNMEDMPKAYKKGHVALIPTRYAEGTSLSCLEAMATNNALIATNIGGLPNLVVDGFNGLLIDPTVDALIDAVETLNGDRSYTKLLADRGLDMVSVFEKNKWDERWKTILKEFL